MTSKFCGFARLVIHCSLIYVGTTLSVVVAQTPVSPEMQRVLELLADQQRKIDRLEAALEAITAAPKPATVTPAVSASPVAAAPTANPSVTPPPSVGTPKVAALTVAAPKVEPAKPAAPRWYEKYAFRGYTQVRGNRILATNNNLQCAQCDSTIGGNNNLSFRRARFVLFGDISDRVSIYFQPDFATTNGNLNFGQIRDLYFDIALDKKKEFRLRVGQSKIPFGFENLQSSQNRLALDRDDAINSAASNEREIAVFGYWAPAKIRARFASLTAAGLKGTGDYGVIGVGVYNGQTGNRPEANNNIHSVARVSYPWQLSNGRFIEAGLQAYSGKYTVTPDQRTASTTGPTNFLFADRRAAASLTIYPQPWGLQAEYNIGKGPQFNPAQRAIEERSLRGGYAQTMYMKRFKSGQIVTPFFRHQYYSGGKKHELDARSYLVRSNELGVEWQFNSALELTTQYSREDRRYEDGVKLNNRQQGHLIRMQLQVNY